MSAANPLPSSPSAVDKRAYEPSMEEILASIRRIIADDQSLPGRVAPAPPELDPSPSVLVRREPMRPASPSAAEGPPASPTAEAPTQAYAPSEAIERPVLPAEPDLPLDSGMAHGAIAAPQFAMPDGPVGDGRLQQREQARVAFQALHGRVQPSAPLETADDRDPSMPETMRPQTAEREPQAREPGHEAPTEPEPVIEPVRENKTALFSDATDSAVSAAFNMLAASRLADNSDELMTLAREMIRPLLRNWIDDNLPSMVERMVRAEIERVARGGR